VRVVRWALKRGHVREHIIRTIDIPSPFPKPIEPYTREEIEALLKATEYSKPYKNNPKRKHRRQTHLRDRLLILLYLDTGCRESELANAKVKHLSLSLHRLHVYGKGRGNMGKERDVFFGKQVYDDFWKYLNSFNPPLQEDDPIFPTMKGGLREHLTPDEIYKLIKRLAEQAEIPGATVHRLRHTFAISFLRNNGKPEVLVGALGHADLKMTMRYLKIAETDRRKEADKTSPVDHWKLR
jgi:integrase/recombinase XerD